MTELGPCFLHQASGWADGGPSRSSGDPEELAQVPDCFSLLIEGPSCQISILTRKCCEKFKELLGGTHHFVLERVMCRSLDLSTSAPFLPVSVSATFDLADVVSRYNR